MVKKIIKHDFDSGTLDDVCEITSAMFCSDPSLPNQVSEDDLFDWSLYGATLRNKRIKMGYKTAETFVKSVWRRTRVTISAPSLYRIERGQQIPDALQFMALNITASWEFFPEKLLASCISDELQFVVSNKEIPQGWKIDNTGEACTNGDLHVYEVMTEDGHEYEDCDYFPDDEALFSLNKAPEGVDTKPSSWAD